MPGGLFRSGDGTPEPTQIMFYVITIKHVINSSTENLSIALGLSRRCGYLDTHIFPTHVLWNVTSIIAVKSPSRYCWIASFEAASFRRSPIPGHPFQALNCGQSMTYRLW